MNKVIIKKAFQNKRRMLAYKTVAGVMLCAGAFSTSASANDDSLTYVELMGKYLFFEEISLNDNMACATCHTGRTGGTGGNSETNLGEVAIRGSNPDMVGALKPPTNKYVQFINSEGKYEGLVNFGLEACQVFIPGVPVPIGVPCGGAFWNGRAEGDLITRVHEVDVFEGLDDKYKRMYKDYLGPLADQAHFSPYINPVEQAHETKKDVCEQVMYETTWGKELYKYVWGKELSCDDEYVDTVFSRFAVALSAWQMSKDNNRFDSKRDIAIRTDRDGKFPLDYMTEKENLGHDLFYGKARCSFCHQSGNDDGLGETERYTDDRYFNIGVPRNYEIPGYPTPDVGLFAITSNENHRGEHKVPTLRNVDKRPHPYFAKAYTHNGWFKSLEQLVHFYNSSDVPTGDAKIACDNATTDEEKKAVSTACYLGKTLCESPEDPETYESYPTTVEEAMYENCWPAPEIDQNIARFGVGDLGLTPYEEEAIVAYLKTLSDKTSAKEPEEYRSRRYDESRLERHYVTKKPFWEQ